MNLASSGLLLRAANIVECDGSTNLDTDSVSTTSSLQMNSLENSFALPMYISGDATNIFT